MSRQVFHGYRKVLLLAFVSCFVLSPHAMAGITVVPGCDPLVLKAMQDKAAALVAADTAAVEQTIKKPDSVLALTCFNQAAGVSAKKGGEIFSGDFTAELSKIVTDSLKSIYKNFLGAIGQETNPEAYQQTQLTDNFNCDEMKKLWETTQNEGIEKGAPVLVSVYDAAPPEGAGEAYKKSWLASAAQGVFERLKAAVNALPKPKVPDFSKCKTVAQVVAVVESGGTCQ